MPHALLLVGSAGIGKNRFASHLAHYLLCESPQRGAACGDCRKCQLLAAGTHPDLRQVAPEAQGKQIKVDQVRELVAYLSHTAQLDGYKVVIIHPAESMNRNAANALLKCLEEPTPKTLLILCTDSPGSLLATIRSRCQMLRFDTPSPSDSRAWLQGISASAPIDELLAEANNQPLTALSLLQDEGLLQRASMREDFNAMLAGKKSPLEVADSWQALELNAVLTWLNRRIEQAIRRQADDANRLRQAAPLFTLRDSVSQLSAAVAAGANPNKLLALESLLLASCEKFIK